MPNELVVTVRCEDWRAAIRLIHECHSLLGAAQELPCEVNPSQAVRAAEKLVLSAALRMHAMRLDAPHWSEPLPDPT